MNKIVTYAWCFFLVSLTFGLWTIPITIVAILVIWLIVRKKPEWFK